jgi:hypothetical protein
MEKLESHMTYLAGSHILRSWPGIQLKEHRANFYNILGPTGNNKLPNIQLEAIDICT